MQNINSIFPYEKNAKKHPKKQIQQVADSIREFGFNQPIVVDQNNIIIVGHGRLEAAKLLGIKEVPVLKLDVSEDKAKAYRLADNKLNESEWDMELVIDELKELNLSGFDIELTGFDLDLVFEPEDRDEEVPSVPDEATSQEGDVYQLGEHRLMCGDSTKLEDVEKLMDNQKADLVFTDPPYGMKKEKDGVLNDNLNYNDLLNFNKLWLGLTFEFAKLNCSWYCWGIDEPLMDIYSNILKPKIKEQKITFRNLIIWDKGNGQGQNFQLTKSYAIADEKCLFFVGGKFGTTINGEDYNGEWDEILNYLRIEEKQSGIFRDEIKDIVGKHMYSHYFTKSQFILIPKNKYLKLQEKTGFFKKEHAELKCIFEKAKKDIEINQFYFNNTHDNFNNVWHFERTGNEERKGVGGHATPKPIALCSRAIKSSSVEKEIVLDVFGGSGSTLIAAEKLGRKCYMMELDPRYVDVIVQRWEDYTGQEAIKL